MAGSTTSRLPTAARVVGVLTVLGTVGSAFMALSHSGIDMPLLNTPELPVVVVIFTVGTAIYGLAAWGTFTRRSWAWPTALVVNAVGFASTIMPWRGWDRSGVPALVTLVALAVLISRPGRQAMLYGTDTTTDEPYPSGSS